MCAYVFSDEGWNFVVASEPLLADGEEQERASLVRLAVLMVFVINFIIIF